MKTIALSLLLACACGCATNTVQLHDKSLEIHPDGTKIQRDITTDITSTAVASSAQKAAKFKALQTDKTQSVNGDGLSQHGATNIVELIRGIADLVEKASPK